MVTLRQYEVLKLGISVILLKAFASLVKSVINNSLLEHVSYSVKWEINVSADWEVERLCLLLIASAKIMI